MTDEYKVKNKTNKEEVINEKSSKYSEKIENNSSENTVYISNIAKLISLCITALMIVGTFFFMTNTGLMSVNFINNDESNNLILGNESTGYVIKKGPYGNTSSNITIAYIIGVHPKEFELHDHFENLFNKKENNLNYCYYIYKIDVIPSIDDFENGRNYGQILAKKYVVPDVINNKFNFATDLHYNIGSWGYANFVFVPKEEDSDNESSYAEDIANNFVDRYDWASYFMPENPTSPEYVTIPLNKGNVPSMIYEGYAYEEEEIIINHLNDLIEWIDNYPF